MPGLGETQLGCPPPPTPLCPTLPVHGAVRVTAAPSQGRWEMGTVLREGGAFLEGRQQRFPKAACACLLGTGCCCVGHTGVDNTCPQSTSGSKNCQTRPQRLRGLSPAGPGLSGTVGAFKMSEPLMAYEWRKDRPADEAPTMCL